MKPVAKKATPAAIAVLRQATALKPRRKKTSDGLLPSAAHLKQNPDSDHNTGYAVDLTHDPVFGIDCHQVFERLRTDPRVKYLIFKGKIWTPEKGERSYTGPNPHNHHIHISIKETAGKDTRPWFPWLDEPKKTPRTITKTAIAKVQKPKKKPVKTGNDKLRRKSLLTSLFKKGKK